MASGALYLPVEIYELLFRFSMVKVVILTTNVVVVACMAYALLQRRSARQAALDDGL
jgi:uncharacterized membrane protein (DUF2068 family)